MQPDPGAVDLSPNRTFAYHLELTSRPSRQKSTAGRLHYSKKRTSTENCMGQGFLDLAS